MWSGNPALINYCEEQEEEEEGGEVRFVMRESWVWSRHQGDITQCQLLRNSQNFSDSKGRKYPVKIWNYNYKSQIYRNRSELGQIFYVN